MKLQKPIAKLSHEKRYWKYRDTVLASDYKFEIEDDCKKAVDLYTYYTSAIHKYRMTLAIDSSEEAVRTPNQYESDYKIAQEALKKYQAHYDEFVRVRKNDEAPMHTKLEKITTESKDGGKDLIDWTSTSNALDDLKTAHDLWLNSRYKQAAYTDVLLISINPKSDAYKRLNINKEYLWELATKDWNVWADAVVIVACLTPVPPFLDMLIAEPAPSTTVHNYAKVQDMLHKFKAGTDSDYISLDLLIIVATHHHLKPDDQKRV
ncbi:hypothetical protein SARC_01427 [Sphaeroforma arctica JP610]|uniref:Uncharacterized protein n=1 Tax=Sphaeroforma arctica JP610 TaxID=667725 RepID=A0A0L0GBZ9_9EUKA|nr:hypothetical protein SARC_01427 [Sphaeroforma arctica JP610]KNC86421.1 hypothetical protein SARC_01427 [Sphaeroforma arctica JP610]|eukprot:XP_014160323.1 hypothetical protein SARC_01427 [Sphaeroforma arctica JP610]